MEVAAAVHIIDDAAASYPKALRRLRRAPRTLWLRGTVENFKAISKCYRKVAVVGSRAALTPDIAKATALAGHVASQGGVVISGGALGIDAAAHRGALSAGGATCAVLGCGIDIVYPDRHATLFAAIAERGAVLSQFAPGVTPQRGTFVARNATVAALADAVVVVGANAGSGALHTVTAARTIGVPVLAIPGAEACDRLIAAGHAVAINDGEELDAFCSGNYEWRQASPPPVDDLTAHARALLASFPDDEPRDEAWLVATSGVGDVAGARALIDLELQQFIELVAPSRYRRVQRRVMRALPRPLGQQVRRCHGD